MISSYLSIFMSLLPSSTVNLQTISYNPFLTRTHVLRITVQTETFRVSAYNGASWDAACCEQGVFFGGLARSRSTRTARYKHFYGTSAVWAETTDDKREAGI